MPKKETWEAKDYGLLMTVTFFGIQLLSSGEGRDLASGNCTNKQTAGTLSNFCTVVFHFRYIRYRRKKFSEHWRICCLLSSHYDTLKVSNRSSPEHWRGTKRVLRVGVLRGVTLSRRENTIQVPVYIHELTVKVDLVRKYRRLWLMSIQSSL